MAYLETTDLGTYKRVARTTISTVVTGAGVTNVDVSALVPAGTKAIDLFITATDATVGTLCRARETGSSSSRAIAVCAVANQQAYGQGIIMLDASYTFDIDNSAAWDAVALYIHGILL